MPKFNPPEPFNFDQPHEWEQWQLRFKQFRLATKLDKDDAPVQLNSLLYAMGQEANQIYAQFQWRLADAARTMSLQRTVDTLIRW